MLNIIIITHDIPTQHLPAETQIQIRTDLALVKTELSGTVKYSIPFSVVQSLFQQYDRSPRRVIVNKNQASRSEYEAKKEVAATIEDEDEEDKEIMEVLGAEEVDTELDYEVDSEATKKEREANI